MDERFARVGDITLCYEQLGRPEDPAVLLVMGLGLQLVAWRDPFCEELVARGLRVIRFDNRDTGRSTRMRGPGVSGLQFLRRRARASYTLEDMADDAAGLLAQVAPEGAVVVGASLGSMIAQQVAIRHPDRTRGLVSIMGRPGDGRTGKVARSMLWQFLRPPGRDPVEDMVKAFHRIGSIDRTEQDDEDARIMMRRALAREGAPDGAGRQLAAILAETDRTDGLRGLRMPATVIHGLRDRIILPDGGRATAAAIPGAELVEIPGMGHDLPRWTWPVVADAIAATVRRA